jgi:biopolymer transport protein ExbD
MVAEGKVMRWWFGMVAAVGLSIAGNCTARPAPVLHLLVLADGKVRFDDGPELSNWQLRAKIRALKQEHPRPEIRLVPSKTTPYKEVATVLRTIARTGYGPHLGFAGYANSN